METPSSTRRMTRSQTSAIKKSAEKQNNQDRSALVDITNDSPIVGLAMGCLETPSSAISKRRTNVIAKFARTPGSGEALLRGQVKTLLQKVEEEAEVSKITIEKRPLFDFQGIVSSPAISLVAPTPANTPQVLMMSANGGLGLPPITPSNVSGKILVSQMANEMTKESVESDDTVTRSLMLDFSEKSNKSDLSDASSVVTYQGLEKFSTDDEDEAASVWSMQVNASSTRDDDEDEDYVLQVCEKYDEYDEEEEETEECGGDNYGILDELCEGISKMSVGLPKFSGKHIRFVYNSEDEIEAEEEEEAASE